MTKQLLKVVVVDDDFMIAQLHGRFIASQKGYKLVGTAHSFSETLNLMETAQPDLLLLDVYLPDRSGIEILRTIRTQKTPCDVILITAAKEKEIVEEGFRLGIIDYLMKPFDLNQLKESLLKYIQYKTRLSSSKLLNQGIVDDLKKLRISESSILPQQKGIDMHTFERIKQCFNRSQHSLSVDQISKLAGVSLSTTRNYLSFMVEEQILVEEYQYGTVGRPLRLYRLIQTS